MLAALSMNAGYTRVESAGRDQPRADSRHSAVRPGAGDVDSLAQGIPITKGSPDHFALRLRRCKLSVRETAVTTYIVAGCLAASRC